MKSVAGKSEIGIVLIAVLWGVALLSLMAASALSSGGLSYRMARNTWAQVRGEALADAGISRAILGLMDKRIEKRWRVDSMPVHLSFGDATVTVRIQDELGRIDLNAADGALLTNLFLSVGVPADRAEAVVDKILDWRDAGSTHRLHGAKDAEYRDAGYSYGPRNGPFQSVDELQLVMGVTPELYRSVSSALTVYSGRAAFDPRIAPKEVLLALSSANAESVEDMLAGRSADNAFSGDQQSAPPGVLDAGVTLAGRAFSITAEVVEAEHQWRRQEVVRLTEDAHQPFWVLMWK